ncbi:hypothetical protein BR93DRAFT_988939, partial [Coniochaeta sp. PMI_546]
MIVDDEITLSHESHLAAPRIFDDKPEFNIRTTPISSLLSSSEAFQNLSIDARPTVEADLKTLQRIQALVPAPDALPVLVKRGVTSAHQISNMPEEHFVSSFEKEFGSEKQALIIHRHAVASRARNEHFLVSALQTVRGSGFRVIDGGASKLGVERRVQAFDAAASNAKTQVNLEKLFGSLDYCDCSDCTSVYSPASYYVELLEFLRHNNLRPDNHNLSNPSNVQGTQLEQLLRRRPDLACLQLTCENTNTLIPYIDLALEVMESYVVHATIKAYNVDGETSGELLCQPQHTDLATYEILRDWVYPFNLPYNFALDVMRVFFTFLKTSRAEMLEVFSQVEANSDLTTSESQTAETDTAAIRAYSAEFNLISQEEYIILTRQGFFKPKCSGHAHSCACHDCGSRSASRYAAKIKLRQPWEYYGYKTEAAMQDLDETNKTGLTWVKAQFLKRTGIQYTDLVSLLKTKYINPNLPTGKALVTMEKIRFSYRFLSLLVHPSHTSKQRKYSRLVWFLCLAQPLIPLIEWAKAQTDPCAGITGNCGGSKGQSGCGCGKTKNPCDCHCQSESEWRCWVWCWFEKVGKLIVLESGEGPRLPVRGRLWAERMSAVARSSESLSLAATDVTEPSVNESSQLIGTLDHDGSIVGDDGEAVGIVGVDSIIVDINTGKPLYKQWQDKSFEITLYMADEDRSQGRLYYYNYSHGERSPKRASYTPPQDTCNIEKVRLIHLDGSPVTSEEYDRMQRFLRLKNKMAWSIEETDVAISGLGTSPVTPSPDDDCDDPESEVESDKDSDVCGGNGPDKEAGAGARDITPELIQQLVSVKKLLDFTGLQLPVLLTFWADIPTRGEGSLYAKTFLTHNLVRLDPVFQGDENGNYLAGAEKITQHLTVIQAALRLSPDDVTFLLAKGDIFKVEDDLNIKNVSALFRWAKLAGILRIRIPLLADILVVFGYIFENAAVTFKFLDTWTQISDAGFTFEQVNYVLRDQDNISRPLAPTQTTTLKLTKTLLDNLLAIDVQHPDVSAKDIEDGIIALPELLSTKLALFFAPELAAKIAQFINGQYEFTTNAPSNLIMVGTIPAKLKYVENKTATPPTAQLTVTGIMSLDETNDALALSNHPLWKAAIERLQKQAVKFYSQTLATFFPAEENPTLLQPDSENTAKGKALYFLKYFLPILRASLAKSMIQRTVADSVQLPLEIASYLLSAVRVSPEKTAIDNLLELRSADQVATTTWEGLLIPPTTDTFTFTVTSDTQPLPMKISDVAVPFPTQSEDPSNLWSSAPFPMASGTLYKVALDGISSSQLSWSTTTSPMTAIVSSAWLPSLSSNSVQGVLAKLKKLSILIQGFELSLDEIIYFHEHIIDFVPSGQNDVTLETPDLNLWKRINAYTILRNKLPKQKFRLIDLFKWAATDSSAGQDVVPQIAKLAPSWDATRVRDILTGWNSVEVSHFKNEVVLVTLQRALEFVKKVNLDVKAMFEWSKPVWVSNSGYTALVSQSEALKNALRARYSATEWEQAAKSLFDTLRIHQRDALVAYLLVEESLVKTGIVVDADGLFEYFFIDCQMSSCLQTSRIKQAISTVQLYVQRCLLGLEAEVGVKESDRISRTRWEWMKRYRIWEANRKVYLYPENWIVPSLRDDKTPFFLDLESALLQKDVSLANAVESLKSYIYAVTEVANMKVYGLFLQRDTQTPDSKKIGVHIAARRMNAPYHWYSRDYTIDGLWTPWVKIPVDIPTFDVEDENGKLLGSGSFVSPFIWQAQPILFFLQMVQKSIPRKGDDSKTMQDRLGGDSLNQYPPIPVWEIRLGYTIYQNGKWTQKQLSSDSLRHRAKAVQVPNPREAGHTLDVYPLPDQTLYQMNPRNADVSGGDPQINIDIWHGSDIIIGHFIFSNGGVSHAVQDSGGLGTSTTTIFHFKTNNDKMEMHSFQADDSNNVPQYYGLLPMVVYDKKQVAGSKSVVSVNDSYKRTFNHTFIDPLLKSITASSKIDDLFASFTTLSEQADSAVEDDPFGSSGNSFHEGKSPNAIYNWELGLHAPMTLIDSLLKAQQFDDALSICHKIFDPSAIADPTAPDGDNSKYWKFYPFKALANTDAKDSLEATFLQLQPQTPNDEITEWRDNPFSPHAVARTRPVAYMKWIAMKYIEIMIAYGDYYFRQNSLETIPNAIQCYVIASHVYGPRGQKIPMRGKKKPQTYMSLLDKWDAFGNAVVQLEVEFPFSNQTSLPIGGTNGVIGFANIFGFATSLYFCIPDNPKLRELRDTIDDRLFKIRHCMDINGVVRNLPLFDPPIDPGLLVQAVAQGISLDSVLLDISGPIPNYRFLLLVQKALELCSELKSLGSQFLTIKEKRDAEALAVLRTTHETLMSNLVLDIKNRQYEEAQETLTQIQRSREGPVYRLQYFKSLVGVTDGAPTEVDDFNEIPNASLEAPTESDDLMLIPSEKEEVDKADAALKWNLLVGGVETLAAIFHAWPTTEAAAKPMGAGAGLYWGGVNMGNAASAAARGLQIYTGWLSASSANAARRASLLRQLQDRVLQANSTGFELKNIDRQITVQKMRVTTAQKEVTNQESVVEQAEKVEEFLRSKYTNEELYAWMEGTTKTLYKQAYDLAFDLAKRAEKAYNFERPSAPGSGAGSAQQFVKVGYWNSSRDGLLAGEQLYLSLKQLEAAYQSKLGYDFEAIKAVSVRQWAPLALVEFRDTGAFELQLPEILFDMDFPGHYMRRITSVSVTIPCVVGPFTSIGCTLRLLSHEIRTKPRAASVADYPKSTEGGSGGGGIGDPGEDDRFAVTQVPISSVVLSSAQNDNGRHDPSGQITERYSPFEGAGVISRWRFELPDGFRQFDYSTISDVVLTIRYTSLDGGDKLRDIAAKTVSEWIKSTD